MLGLLHRIPAVRDPCEIGNPMEELEICINSSFAPRFMNHYHHTVDAPPVKVFPLLCPKREYDWTEGWGCHIVYSQLGVPEKYCVFVKDFPEAMDCG